MESVKVPTLSSWDRPESDEEPEESSSAAALETPSVSHVCNKSPSRIVRSIFVYAGHRDFYLLVRCHSQNVRCNSVRGEIHSIALSSSFTLFTTSFWRSFWSCVSSGLSSGWNILVLYIFSAVNVNYTPTHFIGLTVLTSPTLPASLHPSCRMHMECVEQL